VRWPRGSLESFKEGLLEIWSDFEPLCWEKSSPTRFGQVFPLGETLRSIGSGALVYFPREQRQVGSFLRR
jgi:hypothetical protein